MRDYKNIIKEAELLASSPEAVVTYLKERSSQDGDDELEQALLGLNHPLIDLALAQYGHSIDVLKALFHRGQLALRVAVLANQVAWLARGWDKESLDNLFDRLENLATASGEEIRALFENPKLDNCFVYELLNGDVLWKALEEEKQILIVRALYRTKRIQPPASFDDSDIVFTVAWRLAEKVPVSDQWAATLAELYEPLQPNNFPNHFYGTPIHKPLEVIKRWYPVSAERIAQEQKDNDNARHLTILHPFTYFHQLRNSLAKAALSSECKSYAETLPERKEHLAKLALSFQHEDEDAQSAESVKDEHEDEYVEKLWEYEYESEKLAYVEKFLESEDVALRTAVYSCVNLTCEQITQAYEKDGQLAFDALVENRHLWKDDYKRDALKDIVERATLLNPFSSLEDLEDTDLLDGTRCFKFRDKFEKEHPEWFQTEEDTLKVPATKGDLEKLSHQIILPNFQHLLNKINVLENRLDYVWWFSLGALLVASAQYF